MTWLRIDDKFARHPKVTRLARGDRWTWLEVLCYCSEYRTEGSVPDAIRQVVPKATSAFLNRCYELHLLDIETETENARYIVHDWAIYNGGTIQERVFAYLDEHPEASANDVQKDVGGARKLVLQAVREYQEGGSNAGTVVPPTGTKGGSETGTESVTRARAPSPPLREEPNPHPSEGFGSSTRSDETDAAAPSPNGRAALDTTEDIPLERAGPTFPCSECAQTFTNWEERHLHLDIDHAKEHA